MADLQAALDDAVSGQGRLVMLAGEPGIGKTRTAQELAGYAQTLDRAWWSRLPLGIGHWSTALFR